jgi:hypothetical protein
VKFAIKNFINLDNLPLSLFPKMWYVMYGEIGCIFFPWKSLIPLKKGFDTHAYD